MGKINFRYIFTGIFLTAALVSVILLTPKTPIPLADSPVLLTDNKDKGPRDAPVQIREYTDFQCPACAMSQEVMNEFFEKYPGKIHLVFCDFPLSGHYWSLLAHHAATCAARAEKFWEYHDILYKRQKEWGMHLNPTTKMFQYAQMLGIDVDRFAGCMTDEDIREEVLESKKEGKDLKVAATPTFFINDKRFVGVRTTREEGEIWIRQILGLEPEAEKEKIPEKAEGDADG